MDKWIGRVALVTGASSGIGSAIAERMVKAGIKVVGCARNIKPIQVGNTILTGGEETSDRCLSYCRDSVSVSLFSYQYYYYIFNHNDGAHPLISLMICGTISRAF